MMQGVTWSCAHLVRGLAEVGTIRAGYSHKSNGGVETIGSLGGCSEVAIDIVSGGGAIALASRLEPPRRMDMERVGG